MSISSFRPVICGLLIIFSALNVFSQEEDILLAEDLFAMSFEELLNVDIITAGKQSEKVGEIPASVVIITREDIEKYGYLTLIEILENVPGLYNINNYYSNGNFGVRGFWSGMPNRNIVILVNGVNQVGDYSSNTEFSKVVVPTESIDRIEVVRGPMSVIYGNGAFFGVINIITNETSDNSNNTFITASVGSQKTYKSVVRFEKYSDDFKLVFNASVFNSYGIDQSFSKLATNMPPGISADEKTGGTLESNEKYFSLSGTLKDISVEMCYMESLNENYFLFPAQSSGLKPSDINTYISVNYKKELSDMISFDTKFNYFKYRKLMKYDYLFDDFYGIEHIETTSYEVEFNTFIKPSSWLDITIGLHQRTMLDVFDNYDLPSFGGHGLENNYFYLDDEYDVNTRAIFTQLNITPFKNLKIVGGVRFEQMPKYKLGSTQTYLFDSVDTTGAPVIEEVFTRTEATYKSDKIEIIPRFAAIYILNERNVFKLLYGQATNRPSFFNNTKNTLNPNLVDLESEKIKTIELNYISSFSSGLTINFSIFRNTLSNLITRVSELDTVGNYSTWNANAGEMITDGLELTISAKPIENLDVELSGTYQKTIDKRNGYENLDVAYSPGILGYFKVSYLFEPFGPNTTKIICSMTGNYVDAMETFWDDKPIDPGSGDFTPYGRIGDKTDGFLSMGANINIKNLFNTGLFLNFRVSNLLNEEIRYPTFTNNAWADKGTLGHKRFFMLSAGWKF